ncbi:MAG: HAD family hydrolase [Clostridia bacterium]|nr:HAD family hydrolase [Clostridia bacterium]
MRVFDFDNTIYKGESVLDFYLFSIKYNPAVLKYFFIVIYHTLRYKSGKTTLESLENIIKKHAKGYLSSFDDIDKIVCGFWDKNFSKIKKWYTPRSDDIIITASFDLIMTELFRRLDLTDSLCSIFNRNTMEIEYINFSTNKKIKFIEKFGNVSVDEFYTDSMFDTPMIQLAKKAYLVKGNRITQIR